MRTPRTVLAAPLALALAATLAAPVADACGGCFHPPMSAAQVVTDHRMVLSLSTARTTLWDQFQYAGRASEFSWILPIRYTERTQVQLASDDFVTLLSGLTVPTIVAPTPPPLPPGCTPPPFAGGGGLDASAGGFQDAPWASDSGVSVLREEVVGPYAVSILRGTDAMVLRRWLTDNNYVVPAGLEPTLQHYIDLSMDFVALRLRPGEGLNRMVPVRVSVEGYQPRLPLRMIAAGIADKVGLSLLVLNESRVETSNFPNAAFRDEDFVYDWSAPPQDLARVVLNRFDAINRANGGRVWVTESALRLTQSDLVARARSLGPRQPFVDAGVMQVASAVDDATFAFDGIGATAMVTRLRADLEGRMLDRDLDLAASTEGERSRAYRFGTEVNRPMYAACPWPITDAGAGVDASAPGGGSLDGGAANAGDGSAPGLTPSTAGGGVQCGARPGARGAGDVLLAAVVAVGAALRRRRRAG